MSTDGGVRLLEWTSNGKPCAANVSTIQRIVTSDGGTTYVYGHGSRQGPYGPPDVVCYGVADQPAAELIAQWKSLIGHTPALAGQ